MTTSNLSQTAAPDAALPISQRRAATAETRLPASALAGSGDGSVALSAWSGPLLGAAALLAILGWLFWDFLYRQMRFAWEQQSDWGHTLVIPFIAGYFVYLQRKQLLTKPLVTTWLGLVPMIGGVALYLFVTIGPLAWRHHNLQGGAIALTITGLVLLFCGWRGMRWLAFPLMYLFVFGQTISEHMLNLVTFRLQDITARGAAFLLTLFLDVEREGNNIFVQRAGQDPLPLNIAEACSGMRMLMAFLALGTAMAFTGLKAIGRERSLDDWYRSTGGPTRLDASTVIHRIVQLIAIAACVLVASLSLVAYGTLRNWQRVLLVLLAVPTAIFVNILRVCTLGVLGLVDSGFAAGDFHSFVGLVWLLPAFLIYLGLMWIIRNLVIEAET